MLNTNFPPWPSFTEAEIEAASAVLRSNAVNYWTGNEGKHFETEFAEFAGTDYAIAMSNGTIALEAALAALGIGAGDEVVVTPRTFLASASTIVLAGATPVFADVDADTQNITAESIERVLTPRTRAIVCVHLAGMPCDMDPINKLATEHDLRVLEDCAQAHGAHYKDRPVGSLGDIAAWSFCQDKIMTTGGEGGMVTTNSEALMKAVWSFKDHGKSWEAVFERSHPPGFRWLHEDLGTNGRMTEAQAAIGRIQLGLMDDWTRKRQRYAEAIWSAAADMPGLRVPAIPDWAGHAAYKCYVFVEPDELAPGWDRDRIMNSVSEAGVPCFSGSCSEVYLEKAFKSRGLTPIERLPVARRLGETSLMFLVHPTLEDSHIDQTCEVLSNVMSTAAR